VELEARARRRTDARFLLVGPDEPLEPGTRAALVAEIRDRGLADRVAVSEPLTEADLAAVMADATVVVHPAHIETFGLVVVEALALGTPVVAYAAPGPAHILGGGGGVLVPLGDVHGLTEATLGLLDDPARRQRYADEGRRRADAFTLSRMADGYLAAIAGRAPAGGTTTGVPA
jgi:glycosyltransferase involved in cell wall biosynthesis